MLDEGKVLQDALSDLPCMVELPSYNDAVSLKARLVRYIKGLGEFYDPGQTNPFTGLEITVISPKYLRFSRSDELKTIRLKDIIP